MNRNRISGTIRLTSDILIADENGMGRREESQEETNTWC